MAILKATKGTGKSLGRITNYVKNPEKTEDMKYCDGINCNPNTSYQEMMMTKEQYGKTDGRQYLHYINSFKGHEVTPDQALELTRELVQRNKAFDGFEVLITAHTNEENLHCHIVVNSVSCEDGHKFQLSPSQYKAWMEQNHDLCREHGLSIPEPTQEVTTENMKLYQVLQKADQGKAKSFMYDGVLAVEQAKATAKSKDDFIQTLAEHGYKTKWKDDVKHVTLTDQEGNKMRLETLGKVFKQDYSKEMLLNEFERNESQARTEPRAEEWADYETLKRIIESEQRAENARAYVNERTGTIADTRSNQSFRQPDEERRVSSVGTGKAAQSPSETVRAVTERIDKQTVQGRADFRNHLRELVEKRKKYKSAHSECDREINDLKDRRTELHQGIDRLDRAESKRLDELRRANEKALARKSIEFER